MTLTSVSVISLESNAWGSAAVNVADSPIRDVGVTEGSFDDIEAIRVDRGQ
jgi:hypothetical protein